MNVKYDTCANTKDKAYSMNITEQVPSSYCIIVYSENEHIYPTTKYVYSPDTEEEIQNITKHFANKMDEIEKELTMYNQDYKDKILNKNDPIVIKHFDEATKCHFCNKTFKDVARKNKKTGIKTFRSNKVMDHNHLTGLYRGAACNDCNLREGRVSGLIPAYTVKKDLFTTYTWR
jgi:hypothetical protein